MQFTNSADYFLTTHIGQVHRLNARATSKPKFDFDLSGRYYDRSIFGAWLSLVERTVRDREVGGSNPLAPTSK